MSTARDYFTSTRAKDVMTRDVVTVYASQEMSIAAQKLRDHHITGVPVVSNAGTCLGVLSTKDFLKRSQGDPRDGQVLAYMTTPAVTVSEDHSLLDVAAMLRSCHIHRASGCHIHRVPVVDDRGRVVGILSTLDHCRPNSPGNGSGSR